MSECNCSIQHDTRRVVLTGGPGAGKSAVLELARLFFCRHVERLPEAAGIVFGGRFPRNGELVVRQAAQRAIYHVQRELESTVLGHNAAVVLCDRGTPDGSAYWEGDTDLWSAVGTTRAQELARYDAVIHLRTPSHAHHYNLDNPLRTETHVEAQAIDLRIADAWSGHPRVFDVPASDDFLRKAAQALGVVWDLVPACCRSPSRPFLQGE